MTSRIITMTLRRRETPVRATFLTTFTDAELRAAYKKATEIMNFDLLLQFQEENTLALWYTVRLENLIGTRNRVFSRLALDSQGRYIFTAAGLIAVFEAIIQTMTSELEGSFEVVPDHPVDFVTVFGSNYANIGYGITYPPKVPEISRYD